MAAKNKNTEPFKGSIEVTAQFLNCVVIFKHIRKRLDAARIMPVHIKYLQLTQNRANKQNSVPIFPHVPIKLNRRNILMHVMFFINK